VNPRESGREEERKEVSPLELLDAPKSVSPQVKNLLNHAIHLRNRANSFESREKIDLLTPKEFRDLTGGIHFNLVEIREKLKEIMPEKVKREVSEYDAGSRINLSDRAKAYIDMLEHDRGVHERAEEFGASMRNHKAGATRETIRGVFKNEAALSAALVGYLEGLQEHKELLFPFG